MSEPKVGQAMEKALKELLPKEIERVSGIIESMPDYLNRISKGKIIKRNLVVEVENAKCALASDDITMIIRSYDVLTTVSKDAIKRAS